MEGLATTATFHSCPHLGSKKERLRDGTWNEHGGQDRGLTSHMCVGGRQCSDKWALLPVARAGRSHWRLDLERRSSTPVHRGLRSSARTDCGRRNPGFRLGATYCAVSRLKWLPGPLRLAFAVVVPHSDFPTTNHRNPFGPTSPDTASVDDCFLEDRVLSFICTCYVAVIVFSLLVPQVVQSSPPPIRASSRASPVQVRPSSSSVRRRGHHHHSTPGCPPSSVGSSPLFCLQRPRSGGITIIVHGLL